MYIYLYIYVYMYVCIRRGRARRGGASPGSRPPPRRAVRVEGAESMLLSYVINITINITINGQYYYQTWSTLLSDVQ